MLNISPIRNELGVITHFVGSHANLTELDKMEQQFRQAQKMEALGTLVGGIAHDFNNILAGMTGNLYLAKRSTQQMPDVQKKLGVVEQLSCRAADLIKQLLTFARKDRVNMEPLLLNPFIYETLKLFRASIPENISIHSSICEQPLHIEGNHTQLHQVLMNLVNNARDAVEGGREPAITIALDMFQPDHHFMAARTYVKAGDYAHLSVMDNGCGIPAEQQTHLFEPFFTTKEQGKGTGLGLAMLFGAIKTHQGFIEVETALQQGTTFHIYLPLIRQENSCSTPMQSHPSAQTGHNELILLVDDEASIVDMGRDVLTTLGYRVICATNGVEAVAMFSAHQQDIALIIMDIVMPILGGVQAAERIHAIRPDAKVIFATGYDRETALADSPTASDAVVLSKPYNIDQMHLIIREQIDHTLHH